MPPRRRAPSGPETWHHGLVARWWAEFNVAQAEEVSYYAEAIRRFGEPALDLACGVGRILIPLLEAGFDVDGVDVSGDMLGHAERLAAGRGLAPRLHQQAMHEIDLPRRYATVIVCDSFGIGADREADLETLRRIHTHLAPAGAVVISHDLPRAAVGEALWAGWGRGRSVVTPAPWPTSGDRRRTGNGDDIELIQRTVSLDPFAQRWTLELRALLWREGRVMLEEERRITINLYFAQEMMLMMRVAGFADVRAEGYYTAELATAEDERMIFVARRP